MKLIYVIMLYYGLSMIDAEPAFPRCQEQGSDKSPISLPVVGASIKMDTTRGDGTPQTVAAGELCLIDWLDLLYLAGMDLIRDVANGIRHVANDLCNAFMFPVWRARHECVASYGERVANGLQTRREQRLNKFTKRSINNATRREPVRMCGKCARTACERVRTRANVREYVRMRGVAGQFPNPDRLSPFIIVVVKCGSNAGLCIR